MMKLRNKALLVVLPLGFLMLTTAQAQQQQPAQQQPQQPQTPFTIKVDTQLVVETVMVKDKDGKPIEGLTEKDFTVTEDNVPQTISIFHFERLADTPATEPAATAPAAPAAPVQPTTPNTVSPVAAAAAGSSRYEDRRLLALFFDMVNTSPPDQLRAFTAADKFIRTQIKTPDLISIMTFQKGVVSVLQEFTDDRELLLTTLSKLMYPDEDDTSTDPAGAFGQDSGEFNLFNNDRQLSALQTAATMLRSVNQQKSLVYFSGGLRLSGLDNQAQLRATINAAVRANVAFFPVDARGLVAMAPLGDANRASPGGAGMFSGTTAMTMVSNFQRSQDTLYALASDTGGKAMLDNNDLAAGIVQAQQAITSYYVIGYYTTNPNLDGKFRRIKITLKETPNAKLEYRQGYFAGKSFNKFTAADKERQLEEALMLGDPITDLTIAMEINYFQLNRAEYFVPITAKIPGSELVLARTGGAERTLIDFIGIVKDDYGTTITDLRDKVDTKISGETASELAKRPIQYYSGFTVLPGKYVIKFLARDAETGRIGTYQASFVIPNLMKEEKRIPISSVVLSSQRVEMKEALFNAGKDKLSAAAQAVDPLVADGQRLMPSVTRVFSKSRDMYVYLQAYERNATTTQPMVAFVTFYRGQTKAFETTPLQVVDGLDPKSKALPLRFSLSLSKLPPGEYTCQVTVLDPMGQKAAFWQAPVMLIP